MNRGDHCCTVYAVLSGTINGSVASKNSSFGNRLALAGRVRQRLGASRIRVDLMLQAMVSLGTSGTERPMDDLDALLR